MNIAAHTADRDTLQELARRVRQIAELPEMETRRQRWYRHNDLQRERPMVLCFPEGGWAEILPEQSLVCQSPEMRELERHLRMKVLWWERFRDDNVMDPFYNIPWKLEHTSWGVEVPMEYGDNRGSYHWDPPLKNLPEDLKKLKPRTRQVNRAATLRWQAFVEEQIGDILPTRIGAQSLGDVGFWSLGMTADLVKLVGLEQMMYLMMDQPETIHHLMKFLHDDIIEHLDFLEREHLLNPANQTGYTGSGGVSLTHDLATADSSACACRNLWGFAESQETVGISPDMFAEFVLPYQIDILQRFGLNCYGCCEPVHLRIDHILKIPNLRRVSVSPWADQRVMSEKLGGKVIFSRKPNPTLVCMTFDEEKIRQDLRDTLAYARNGPVEIILKDTHTVQNQPERISRWLELAYEEVDKAATW